jgi:hypothetical protein
MSELNIKYQITGIRDSPKEKGKVEVFMEPVEELEKEQIEHNEDGLLMAQEMPMSPQGIMQMFQGLPEQMGMKKPDERVPRTIIHLEDAIEFKARNWHHGDVMTVTIKKEGQ